MTLSTLGQVVPIGRIQRAKGHRDRGHRTVKEEGHWRVRQGLVPLPERNLDPVIYKVVSV